MIYNIREKGTKRQLNKIFVKREFMKYLLHIYKRVENISKEYHASWINVQLIFETKVNRTRRSDSQALLLIKKKKRKKKESN